MVDQVLLSIIIPVFNRQEALNLLLSVLSKQIQMLKKVDLVELIVIDDFSAIPVSLPKFPCSIQLERNSENLGAPLSRLKGFELSAGNFVHFHDSDDSITEEWLSKLIIEVQAEPNLDFLLTGREVHDRDGMMIKSQKFFHRNAYSPAKIRNWLLYQNCIGPLGGVTFSRELLKKVRFLDFSSCQDWQMYIDAMEHAKVLKSAPDIHFIFNRSGSDRISNNANNKILGHLQLSRITSELSPFKRNLRLFYLFSCRHYVNNSGAYLLRFYNNNQLTILFTFVVVSIYWRLSRNGIIKKT